MPGRQPIDQSADEADRADDDNGAVANRPLHRPAVLPRESIRRQAERDDQEQAERAERAFEPRSRRDSEGVLCFSLI